MKINNKFLLALLFITNISFASPWMTGPLLAPAGKTIPAGHVNIEPYALYTVTENAFRNLNLLPIVTVGLTSFLDLQATLPYYYNWERHQHGSHIADASLTLGLQVLTQKENTWIPDLRFTIQENFPTGVYQNLNPAKFGTDVTGHGSYGTSFGLNFQRVDELIKEHYLRTRLSIIYTNLGKVKVHGLNAFGGGINTQGLVNPGNSFSTDLAFEYSLTQNWVPVFEMLYTQSLKTNFTGVSGFTPAGDLAGVGGAGGKQFSLAPALEYNFNANLGVIAGVWFSVSGPHASRFTTEAIAINYYF